MGILVSLKKIRPAGYGLNPFLSEGAFFRACLDICFDGHCFTLSVCFELFLFQTLIGVIAGAMPGMQRGRIDAKRCIQVTCSIGEIQLWAVRTGLVRTTLRGPYGINESLDRARSAQDSASDQGNL